jgi:threonine-phosphate decarboxylase
MTGPGDTSGWDHGGYRGGSPSGRPVLDSSTTVNPFGPPFSVDGLLAGIRDRMSAYPDPWAYGVERALSERIGAPGDRIVFGPGATSLLYRWVETVRPKRMVLFEPVFSEFGRAAERFGVPVLRVPPGEFLTFKGVQPPHGSRRWKIDLGGFRGRLSPGEVAVIVNPVNPTGQEFSQGELSEFWTRVGSSGAGLLIDESFQDFVGNRSSVAGAEGPRDPGWTVLKSLTKITGLPGIRTGCFVAPPALAQKIRTALGPWSTGAVEQAVGLAWSRSERAEAEGVGRLYAARNRFLADWISSGGTAFEGTGPFLWLYSGWGEDASKIRDRILRESGVYLRIGTGFGPAGGGDFLRMGFEAFRDPGRVMDALRIHRTVQNS